MFVIVIDLARVGWRLGEVGVKGGLEGNLRRKDRFGRKDRRAKVVRKEILGFIWMKWPVIGRLHSWFEAWALLY